MCGIIGYIGDREAVDVIIEGLTRLEYRGYDSTGIAVLNDKLKYIFTEGGDYNVFSACYFKTVFIFAFSSWLLKRQM